MKIVAGGALTAVVSAIRTVEAGPIGAGHAHVAGINIKPIVTGQAYKGAFI